MAQKYLYIDPITRDLEESSEVLVSLNDDGLISSDLIPGGAGGTGDAGIDGKPADYYSDVYRSDATLLLGEYPTDGSFDGTTEVLPTAWSDDVLAPTPGEYVWRSTKRYYAELVGSAYVWNSTGSWSTPVKYMYIPTIGNDYSTSNSFTSYVFRKELIGITPLKPTNGSYDHLAATPETQPTLPEIWLDNPPTQAYNEIIWISTRTYFKVDNDAWYSAFWSEPAIFSARNNLTGNLTNENVSAPSNADGTGPNLTNATGTFKVFYGDTDISADCDFTISGASTKNNLQAVIDIATGIYTITGPTWSSDLETFDFVATYTVDNSSILRTFSINKSKAGEGGESILTRLESSDGTVFKNNTGADKSISAEVYIEGVKQLVTGSYKYKWYNNNTVIYVTGGGDYVGTTQTGGLFLADGVDINIKTIIVDVNDVDFNLPLNLICEISNI